MRTFILACCALALGCASNPPLTPARECPACPACPSVEPEAEEPPAASAEPASLPVDLPRASEVGPQAALLVVALSADGKCYVAGEVLGSCNEIRERAARAHQDNPDVRALIQADRAVAHGAVITVLDQLKQGGISKIAFAVSPAQ
jgi:biopolymer transport protein ExbD